MSLKKRIHSGAPLYIATGTVDMSNEKLDERAAEKPDLLFVDLQHTPYTEPQLVSFCAECETRNLPPLLRIRHPELHTMIGSCLDFGAAGVLVPMVETEAAVENAIRSFYYPPKGERSWFPQHAWKRGEIPGIREYADWWTENGILAIQIETVRGVQNVRKLVKEGVDLILFGAVDLMFSLEANPNSGFATIADCQRFVMEQVADLPVRVAIGDMPFGQFED